MNVEIRPADPDDADQISRLITVLGYGMTPAQVRGRLEESYNGGVFVACEGNVVVGFISFHVIPLFHDVSNLGRITAVAIDPKYHRKGIGRLLIAAAEHATVLRGCSRMEVTSGDHREQDAHLFYFAQGYRSDCRRFQKQLKPRT